MSNIIKKFIKSSGLVLLLAIAACMNNNNILGNGAQYTTMIDQNLISSIGHPVPKVHNNVCSSIPQSIALDQSGNIYSGNSGGNVWQYQFGGVTWTMFGQLKSQDSTSVTAVSVSANNGYVYAGMQSSRVWRYSTQESRWRQVGDLLSLDKTGVSSILASSNSGNIYVGTDGNYPTHGGFVWRYDGTSWSKMGGSHVNGRLDNTPVSEIIEDASSVLYALTQAGNVFKYENNQWVPIWNKGQGVATSVASNSIYQTPFYLGTSSGSVWEESDSSGWHNLQFPGMDGISSVVVGITPGNFYVGTDHGEIWYYNLADAPTVWQRFSHPENSQVSQLVAGADNIIDALMSDGTIWNLNRGAVQLKKISWSPLPLPNTDDGAISSIAVSKGNIVVGTNNSTVWSHPVGAGTWIQISGALPNGALSGTPISSIVVDESGYIYAGAGFMSNVWVSNGWGWNTFGYESIAPNYEIPVTLATDESNNLYVGTSYGAFEYLAQNDSWESFVGLGINGSNSISPVTATAVDVNGNSYFGTENGEVWQYAPYGTNLTNLDFPDTESNYSVSVLTYIDEGHIDQGVYAGTTNGNIKYYNDSWHDAANSCNSTDSVVTAVGYAIPGGEDPELVSIAGGQYCNDTATQGAIALAQDYYGGSALAVGYGPYICQATHVSSCNNITGKADSAIDAMTSNITPNALPVYAGTINGTVWNYVYESNTKIMSYVTTVPGNMPIVSLAEDESGNVYMGTGDGNVNLYNGSTVTRLSGIETTQNWYTQVKSPMVVDAANNRVYVGTPYGNTWYHSGNGQSSHTAWILSSVPHSNYPISAITVDAFGNVLAGNESGQVLSESRSNIVSDGAILSAVAVGNTSPEFASYYVGDDLGFLWQLSDESLTVESYEHTDNYSAIQSLAANTQGAVYAVTADSSIYTLTSGGEWFRLYNFNDGAANSVTTDSADNIYVGTESGDVWLGQFTACY